MIDVFEILGVLLSATDYFDTCDVMRVLMLVSGGYRYCS